MLTLAIVIKQRTKGKLNAEPLNNGCECFLVIKAFLRFSRAGQLHHFHILLWQLSSIHRYLKTKIRNLVLTVFHYRYSINTDQSSPSSPQVKTAYIVYKDGLDFLNFSFLTQEEQHCPSTRISYRGATHVLSDQGKQQLPARACFPKHAVRDTGSLGCAFTQVEVRMPKWDNSGLIWSQWPLPDCQFLEGRNPMASFHIRHVP